MNQPENNKFYIFTSTKLSQLFILSGKKPKNFIKSLDLGVICKYRIDEKSWHFYVVDANKFMLNVIKLGL